MPLPTAKTPMEIDPAKETYVFFGAPGIGKTTFAANFPGAIFAATEPGQRKLEVYQVPITTWAGFIELCRNLKHEKHEFKTLVMDTLNGLHIICAKDTCVAHKIDHESDLADGKGWTLVNREFFHKILALQGLNMGIIFIDHEKEKEIKGSGGKYTKFSPATSNAIATRVCAFVDHILYFDMDDTQKGEVRVIRADTSKYWTAKSRGGKVGEKFFPMFPAQMPMDYSIFCAEYEKNIKILKGEKP